MELSDDDRKLIDRGLLTEREAVRLPQWAKSKIVRLLQERDELKLTLTQIHQGADGSPFYISDGIGPSIRIGSAHSRIEIKFSVESRIYDIALRVEKDSLEIMGGRALRLDLASSNLLYVREQR